MNFAVQGSELAPVEMVVESARVRDYMKSVHAEGLDLKGQAPPTMYFAPTLEGSTVDIANYLGIDYSRGLLGEIAYEVVRPPKVGERLTVRVAISDMYTKESSKGSSSFAVVDARFLDDADELVFMQRATFIERS